MRSILTFTVFVTYSEALLFVKDFRSFMTHPAEVLYYFLRLAVNERRSASVISFVEGPARLAICETAVFKDVFIVGI
jgi:hypothetical protein